MVQNTSNDAKGVHVGVINELQWRGLIKKQSSTELSKNTGKINPVVYAAFDPGLPGLHIGCLLSLITLTRFQNSGYTVIALVEGGTGLLCNPMHNSADSSDALEASLHDNALSISAQLQHILNKNGKSNSAIIVNNEDWVTELSIETFLDEVGEHFLVDDNVVSQTGTVGISRGDDITYTDISCVLLKAYDFLVLNKRYECKLQIGTSKHWPSMIAGIELIRSHMQIQTHAIMLPSFEGFRIKNSKINKTETIWLDTNFTSPYSFYEYWLNVPNQDVMTYLRYLSFQSHEQLRAIQYDLHRNPNHRRAQKTLAKEVTSFVHGKQVAEQLSNTI